MKVLIVSFSAAPDTAAAAQYVTALAERRVAAGDQVRILCTAQPYYVQTETLDSPSSPPSTQPHGFRAQLLPSPPSRTPGVSVHRLQAPHVISQQASGIANIARLSYFGVALAMEAARQEDGHFDEVVITSTPPFSFLLYGLLRRLKRIVRRIRGRTVRQPFFRLWLMDLNREQLSRCRAIIPRTIGLLLLPFERLALREADEIITLDPDMKEAIRSGHHRTSPIVVESLGPLATPPPTGPKPRTSSTPLTVMHGGNLSLLHDLTTILTAASLLKDEPIRFIFTRFGRALPFVESWIRQERLTSFQLIPPRPNEERDSFLLAGDLHILVVGNASVGVCHPSKVYNLIALDLPILYIGPSYGAIYQLLLTYPKASLHRHGDASGVARTIRHYQARHRTAAILASSPDLMM